MSKILEDPRLVTLSEEEAAPILGFTVSTLRKRRWERKPPAFLKVGRKIRYRLSDLQEYLDACTVAPRGKRKFGTARRGSIGNSQPR